MHTPPPRPVGAVVVGVMVMQDEADRAHGAGKASGVRARGQGGGFGRAGDARKGVRSGVRDEVRSDVRDEVGSDVRDEVRPGEGGDEARGSPAGTVRTPTAPRAPGGSARP